MSTHSHRRVEGDRYRFGVNELVGQPWSLTASELSLAYRTGALSPQEVVSSLLEHINELNGSVNAFTELASDEAMKTALIAQQKLKDENAPSLCGIPIAVKEIYGVKGMPFTAQSLARENVRATEDAQFVSQLRQQGAIVLGTTRTHEFAWGITTQHETLGGTRNPWNTDFTPGGSSGGSAVAVASGMAPIALGSDTACSIRLPAAFCGVFGFKPTSHVVSLEGVVPFSPKFDCAGWIARSVADLQLIAQAALPIDKNDKQGDVVIGVSDVFNHLRFDASIKSAFESFIARLEQAGFKIREINLPSLDEIFEVFNVIRSYDAVQAHRDVLHSWPEKSALYSSELRARFEAAETVTREQVDAAEQRLPAILDAWTAIYDSVDVLALPSAAAGPSRIDNPDWTDIDGESIELRSAVVGLNIPANVAGFPVCAIPIGMDARSIPVGAQLMGKKGSDRNVLEISQLLSDTNVISIDDWPPLIEGINHL